MTNLENKPLFMITHSINIHQTQPSGMGYDFMDEWLLKYGLGYEVNLQGLDRFVQNANESGHNNVPWAIIVLHDISALEEFSEGMRYSFTFEELLELGVIKPLKEDPTKSAYVISIVSETTFERLKKIQFEWLMSGKPVELRSHQGLIEFALETVIPVEDLAQASFNEFTFESVKKKLGSTFTDMHFKSSEKYLSVMMKAHQIGGAPDFTQNESDFFNGICASFNLNKVQGDFFFVARS